MDPKGQQRTAVLSLKLSELEFIKSEVGEYPVLLLDDVLSELDESRRANLLQFIHKRIQTFITTTDIHDFKDLKSVQFISCEGDRFSMDSLDLCLPKALSELNLLEQYKLNTLVHKWRDVVGDVIADHTKLYLSSLQTWLSVQIIPCGCRNYKCKNDVSSGY